MQKDNQATAIKFFAIITATPRWVAALLASEGFIVPDDWLNWWIPTTAILSAGMAAVEGWAFAYVFSAWRNQNDKKSNRILWFALVSAVLFVIVLAPHIAASVSETTLSEILDGSGLLWVWSSSVALSTIAIVVSVGVAQKQVRPRSTKTDHGQTGGQPPVNLVDCPRCDRQFKSQNGLNSHIGKKHKVNVKVE